MSETTNLTSKLPVKEHIKNIKNILAVVKSLDRTYFATAGIVHLINAVVPYIELVLSAYIIDALTEGKGFKEIFTVAAATTLGIFILHCIAATVWNRLEVRKDKAYHLYECITEQKMLNMDYSRIDSPEIRDLKERIRRDNNWGAGLYSIFWSFDSAIYISFNILSALIVGIPVIYHIIKSKNILVYVLLLIMVVFTVISRKGAVHFHKRVSDFMYNTKCESDEERKEMVSVTWDYAFGEDYSYKNGKDVRIYGAQEILKHWTKEQVNSKKNVAEVNKACADTIKENIVGNIGSGLIEGGAYIIVGILALAGVLTIGNVIKLAGCLKNLLNEIQSLAETLANSAIEARKTVSTLEFLNISDEMYKGKLPVEKRSDNQYQIEFKNVSFKYPGTESYALKNFSMTLKIGEKLAIVGMNGSGKTTMIKLLCRLYDPDEGEILLNGVDIRKFKQDEYSRLFSVVFQDYQLFSFMLAENVAVSEDYDRVKVENCLRQAGFDERLDTLEEGIKSYLYKDFEDSGIEISGGEAQKIAIARSVYKDAPFILMDEPTAALDPISEYEIYAGFDKMVGDKTAIYISHRLSSCRFCEKIAVFHEGELIQTGSHEELLKEESGKYYEMWNAQAKYYVT